MEANVTLELGGNKYLLTQKTIYNNTAYFVAVTLDKNNNITEKYGILKEIINGDKVLLDLVDNHDELNLVYKQFAEEMITTLKQDKDYLPVGSLVDIENKRFVLMDYVIYDMEVFVVYATIKEPFEMKVIRRVRNDKDELLLEDVTVSKLGLNVIKEFSELHKKQDIQGE